MSAPHPSILLTPRERAVRWEAVWAAAVRRYQLRAELLSDPILRMVASDRAERCGRRRLLALATLAELDGWPRQARNLRRHAAAKWGDSRND